MVPTTVGRSLFLRPLRPRLEPFALPELGEDASVMLRELPGKDLLDLQALHGTTASGLDFAADFLARAIVHENGAPLFADGSDCKAHLTHLPLSAIDRLLIAALKVSGMDGRQVEQGGAAKN